MVEDMGTKDLIWVDEKLPGYHIPVAGDYLVQHRPLIVWGLFLVMDHASKEDGEPSGRDGAVEKLTHGHVSSLELGLM